MIIQSMVDNDTYKFSMLQAVLHQFPGAMVEYKFKCRTENIDFRPYVQDIQKEIDKMCELSFTISELVYLSNLRFMKPDTIEFLKLFKFDRKFIDISVNDEGELNITIRGPWLHTILFEVPVLSIVSEIYSTNQGEDYEKANGRTLEKIDIIRETSEKTPMLIAEFGGRRRHSVKAHYNVLKTLKRYAWVRASRYGLVGTSNVMMAKELGLTPIGTMAHEWLQAHQALYRVTDSQFMALENWAKEYRGDLGIALSDVIGLKYFLHDFDMYFSKLFDGTRHDSGSPREYGEALIKHYESMNIDPLTKTIVFSDGLNVKRAAILAMYFKDGIKTSFGIGTNLTNDFGFKPLQIVLKMTKCNGQPVAKVSDNPAKGMCTDESYVNYLKEVFDRRISK